MTRVLLVEDDPTQAFLIQTLIAEQDPGVFSIEIVGTLGAALVRLAEGGSEAVLLDLTLPDSQGLATVERVRRQPPEVPIVVLTGREDCTIGMEAVKRGAQDYVSKNGASGELLVRTLNYAIERQRVQQELQSSRLAQLRQQERLNRELAERNKDLEEFAYVASHDLQEPLRKMISFGDLLERDLGEQISEKVMRDLQFIRGAAERMRNLVGDLLALSRVGQPLQQRQQLSLDHCVDSALDVLQGYIEKTGAAIERDALPEVWGEPLILTQLYQNLISNAIKFCDNGPPRIRITAEQADGCWVFGVADRGIGIKPEYVDQIFRPFQRLHSPGEYDGSGIGLAICRKAVERHGGEIWVESEPERGSHFKFRLGQRTARRE
jgi:signal transduction histidine kinase